MIPPYDQDAEEQVIGILIAAPELYRQASWLNPDDFYVPHCRKLYEVLEALPNDLSAFEADKASVMLEEARIEVAAARASVDRDLVRAITYNRVSNGHLKRYAGRVYLEAVKRKSQETATDALRRIENGEVVDVQARAGGIQI